MLLSFNRVLFLQNVPLVLSIHIYLKFDAQFSDREDELKKTYDEQMKTLKSEMESVKSDYETKILEMTDRSNQQDVSSSMLRKMKEKHEKELELLREVITLFVHFSQLLM